MNTQQIIRLVMRLFGRRVINSGINYASRRGKPAGELSPEERRQARMARQSAKRARQAARMMRKMR